MQSDARPDHDSSRLLPVQTPKDIEYLVKESEVLTGRSGRVFVISGADSLIYRVHWHPGGQPSGLSVERLDDGGRVLSIQRLQLWEFPEHSLVEAQAAGQLFTLPVRRHG
jgi:hypothetical protein